jgi:uncharacterized protein YcfJ
MLSFLLRAQSSVIFTRISQSEVDNMKKFTISAGAKETGPLLLVAALLSLCATPVWANSSYEYARVLESRPVYRLVEVSIPHQECWDEEYISQRRSGSESRTPTLIGTIIGGAIGNAVGHKKSNKRVGTVVGAVLGHSIGRDIVAANGRQSKPHYETVRQCETVYAYREEERLIGYDVRYRFNDAEYSVRMDNDPGERIRVRVDVQPVF